MGVGHAKTKSLDILFEIALYCYDNNDMNRCISILQQLLKSSPKYFEAHSLLGTAYTAKGYYDNAIKEFLWCYSITPNNIAIDQSVAMLLYKQKFDYKDVDKVTQYLVVKGFTPLQSKNIHAKLIYLCLNLPKIDSIQKGSTGDTISEQEDQIISLRTFMQRGYEYIKRGEFDKAIGEYNKAILIDAKYITAYIDKGNAYAIKLDYQKAISDFNQALTINPNSDMAYNSRGAAYFELGMTEKALADYNEALRRFPENQEALRNRAYLYYKAKKYNESLKDADKLLALNPQNGPCHEIRAMVLLCIKTV